ncbi:hypothetical protein ABZS66_43750 [Dactylosporangium sp. NPDC005572]|uniref:hypothetical protein n=1 Tax=Dactylosporangium sp. NPDC005572 TaxID=3156889 RepID=UPI0033BA3FAC
MAKIVFVHGVGQQLKAPAVLHAEFEPALIGGMELAGLDPAGGRPSVDCVFYGDLFRPKGRVLGPPTPLLSVEDLSEFERQLLMDWWVEAARTDDSVPGPDTPTLARSPKSLQTALRVLSGSKFFAGVAQRLMLSNLRQMRLYLTDDTVRAAVGERIAAAIADDTRVIVGHSMGSVASYEALCANSQWPVQTFVTVGSPLGIRNLFFDQLRPAPMTARSLRPVGRWPGSVRTWTNIADRGDVVALVKDLRPLFGDAVTNIEIHNGAHAHDARPYLTSADTGRVLLEALSAVETGTSVAGE